NGIHHTGGGVAALVAMRSLADQQSKLVLEQPSGSTVRLGGLLAMRLPDLGSIPRQTGCAVSMPTGIGALWDNWFLAFIHDASLSGQFRLNRRQHVESGDRLIVGHYRQCAVAAERARGSPTFTWFLLYLSGAAAAVVRLQRRGVELAVCSSDA